LLIALPVAEQLIGLSRSPTGGARRRVPFDDDDRIFLRSFALLAAPATPRHEPDEQRHVRCSRRKPALRAGVAEVAAWSASRRHFAASSSWFSGWRRPTSRCRRGESGTGKERVARLIHSLSPRGHAPFVPINCAAVPETLLEAELFGIERGVATGVSARVGKFELASGGTLFLDEVGDLSGVLQSKILRVVQEREVERVGGRQRLHVDVRLITATHRDLEAMMAAGEFRPDLYYRLRVVELELPPLRERREDVALLAHHFLRVHGRRFNREGLSLSRAALELLLRHDYPGNVRELENLLEAAVALATGEQVDASDLRLAMGGNAREDDSGTLDEVIHRHVLRTLERCQGNRTAAASELGIDRSTLYRMLVRQNATIVAKSDRVQKDRQKRLRSEDQAE
jgi:transcriptional regulator of acetoin/glycerol metabolism